MKNLDFDINPDGLTIENTLLLSALLCGVTTDHPIVHRLQLFFCANFVVGKKNAEEDFQRSIETSIDTLNPPRLWLRIGRGKYELTPIGFRIAKMLFPAAVPQFSPTKEISDVRYVLEGAYDRHKIRLEREGRQWRTTIDGKMFPVAKDACNILTLKAEDTSAARVLYNMAVKNNFRWVN